MSVATWYTRQVDPSRRVGGFYASSEDAAEAAALMAFDTVIPPRSEQGWFIVPASSLDSQGHES